MNASKRAAKAEQVKAVIAEKVTGKILPRHTAEGHFYEFTDTGKTVSSVTGKLAVLSKPHLIRWAVKKGVEWLEVEERWKFLAIPTMRDSYVRAAQEAFTEIRDDAGSVGTQAHDAAERYVKHWIETGERPENIKNFFAYVDGKIVADARAIASARAFESWARAAKMIPIASEILVGDERYSAGTLDLLYLDHKGCLVLGDLKTSNHVDQKNYSLQVAAYKKFFEGMTGLTIRHVRILHLSKDHDGFTVWKVLDIAKAWAAFKALCAVAGWLEDGEAKCEKDIKRRVIL